MWFCEIIPSVFSGDILKQQLHDKIRYKKIAYALWYSKSLLLTLLTEHNTISTVSLISKRATELQQVSSMSSRDTLDNRMPHALGETVWYNNISFFTSEQREKFKLMSGLFIKFFIVLRLYFYFMCMSIWIYACIQHVCSACGSHKRALNPLKLELEMVVRCHVGTENERKSSERAVSALYLWSMTPGPDIPYLIVMKLSTGM